MQGRQYHISKCDKEIAFLKDKSCPLPGSLAKEYAAQWSIKAASFKRGRSAIEAVLRSDKEDKDFAKKVPAAEASVKDFKDDYKRYKTPLRSYEKKRRETSDDMDDGDDA